MTSDLPQTTLPNGMKVFCIQKYEAQVVYRQVQTYFEHGIEIRLGDSIIDVGANIGLFTLLAREKCGPKGLIYAFEPIPQIFKALSLNVKRYGPDNIQPFPYGLSRHHGEMSFTYFPKMSVVSTAYPHRWKEELTNIFTQAPAQLPWFAQWLAILPLWLRSIIIKLGMKQFTQTQTVTSPVTTLSHVLHKYNIHHVDLLKIDVEKSEFDILLGIDNQDWPKIKQLIVEIHNQDNRREHIQTLLTDVGFKDIHTTYGFGAEVSNTFNLYATR